MKIAVVIGSLRKESVNRAVFEQYAEFNKDVFQFEEFAIGDMPLYNQDIQAPDFIQQRAQAIADCDGVLIFSPEYNYSVPGVLKNALDWWSRAEPQPFAGKPTAIIGASPGAIGTARMQYHLRQVGVFLNMRLLNKPEVMIGGAYDKVIEGKIVDDGTVEFLQTHAESFKQFIES
ncbi:NADPH-dependent FMN reductase [Halioxenophilus aromaticivorans]|uniref:NADPH-dependent FMN reductase n=1 Tax=Halioxenophilus aromaticivorans TaxID=1306992 RepID=A0AAV3U650_9ALTE